MALFVTALDWAYELKHRSDIDRCGFATQWGCKKHLGYNAMGKLLMNGREPVGLGDNGHVTFHSDCFAKLEPGLTTSSPRRLQLVSTTQGDDRDRHRIGA